MKKVLSEWTGWFFAASAVVYNNLFWPGAIMVWPGLQHYERLKGDCVAKNGSAYFFCSVPHVSYPFTALIFTLQAQFCSAAMFLSDINIKSVCKNVFNFPLLQPQPESSRTEECEAALSFTSLSTQTAFRRAIRQ